MTGFGAVAFRALIALVHNATYNGRLSFVYDANIPEAPSRFGGWVFFSPIIGGLIVVYLVRQFAPEAKGHGVPEVMDAVFYKRSNIRGLVARCPHQGAGLGDFDRQRRCRARRPDHPDRLGAGLRVRAGDPVVDLAEDSAAFGRGRSGDRGNL
jgi:hypothetical protein